MYRRKMLFAIAISLLLVVGFMATSLISYFVAKDSVSTSLKEQMLPLTGDNIYSEIQRDLLQPLLISSLMAQDTFVVNWAETGEEQPERIKEYLGAIQKRYGTITAFFVSAKTRNYYHPSGILKQVDPTDLADDWFFRLKKINTDYEINVDWDTADRTRLNIFVNYRVFNRAGEFVGATGVGLSVESVIRLIEEYQARYGRQIYFVNRAGEITLHSSSYESDIRLQNKAGLDRLFVRILTSPSASMEYAAKDGNTIYLNSRLVPEFDWFLIVEQVNDPASERIENALVVNILLSLGITLLVLMLAHFTLRSYQSRLETMATKDKLTGATSRQIFDVIFDRATKTAMRKNIPLSMVSVDLDHFKEINDTYGHQCGDDVLRKFVELINVEVRDNDTLCRWGGEEFVLLLEDCDGERAFDVAETIRTRLKAQTFRFGRETFTVTASFGVAQYQEGESLNALIDRSDRALYVSKRAGRDRVSVQK
ncbi:MAG TPA: sensor domain-containing diguanylate cyclase [Cellvibrionaceae bacterium]